VGGEKRGALLGGAHLTFLDKGKKVPEGYEPNVFLVLK
jgi:hypothetical protein